MNIIYSRDASMLELVPKEVIKLKEWDQIKEVLKETKDKICLRGAGTNLVGNAITNQILIDICKKDKILEINEEEKYVRAEVGIVCKKLEKKLRKKGLELAVKPSSYRVCTLAGMIACNASGIRSVKYGNIENYVMEIEAINGKGEDIKLKKEAISLEGQVFAMKNAKIKVIEEKERTVDVFEFKSLDKLIRKAKELKGKNISALEIIGKDTAEFCFGENRYLLFVEYEGSEGSEDERIWEKREKVYPLLAKEGYYVIHDPKFKFDELETVLEKIEGKYRYFGHLGHGIIHICSTKEQEKEVEEFIQKLRPEKLSGEHGYGRKKSKYLPTKLKEKLEKLRKVHDPLQRIGDAGWF